MSILRNLLALTAAASAIALPELQTRADQTIVSKFDDLATTIVAPQLFPVGAYNGLSWGGLVVLRPIQGAASVVPHSPPQHAGAAGPLDLLYLGQLTLNTYATIQPATGTKSFDLKSFWYGLGTDTGTTAGLAQGGTIVVVAYDVNGNLLPTTSFSYAPQSALNAPLVFGQLPDSYKNLQNVSITVATSEPLTERTYIALDDVTHVNHLA